MIVFYLVNTLIDSVFYLRPCYATGVLSGPGSLKGSVVKW